MKTKILIISLSLLILIPFTASAFKAPHTTTPPTINGVVGSGEWSAASNYNLDFINSAGDLEPTTWYFMNDSSYLYIGVETSTEAHWDTIAGFGIDGNNDNYASGNPAGPHQDFTVGQACSIGWPGHTSYVVYSDGGGTTTHVSPPADLERATNGSSNISYEFKIPISSLNMASDKIAIRFWLLQGGLDPLLYQFFYPQYTTGPAWETVAQWPRLKIESDGKNKDFKLKVTIKPNNAGRVIITPPDIECSKNCEESYEDGTDVTLQASPEGSYEFDCWDDGEDCEYDDPETITMDDDKKITARFLHSSSGITYICEDYGNNIEGSFVIEKFWTNLYGCGPGFTGVTDADGNITCTGTAKVGGSDSLGRCGPGDDPPGPKFGYTQDCFNHDLCVRQNNLGSTPYGFSPVGPCGNEYFWASDDIVWASNCTRYDF